MFLAYRAVVSSSEVSIWCRLRMVDGNLLRHVITFLWSVKRRKRERLRDNKMLLTFM
jgi:hypothetical protein